MRHVERLSAFPAVFDSGFLDAANLSAFPESKEQPVDERMLAQVARRYLRLRRRREGMFTPSLFGDPAWDIMVDLFASNVECRQISVSSSCIASNVPVTTALRYIRLLEKSNLVTRTSDPLDGRRDHVELTPAARRMIGQLLSELMDIGS